MADNTTINAGSGGDTIATDDIGGVKYQRVKIAVGADGQATDLSVGDPMPVTSLRVATATLSNVVSSDTNVTLLDANPDRQGASIFNDSTSHLFVKYGETASATSYTVRVAPGQLYELPAPVYTGVVDGIWESEDGAARVTEVSV